MRQRDTNAIRLGMLAGLIRVVKFQATLWPSNKDADTRFLIDGAVEHLQKAHDLLTAPPALIEVPND